MSLAYYIVLDVKNPGFETFVNGKAVAHAIEELDALCQTLKLPLLDSFMSQGIEEFADLLDEEIEEEIELPEAVEEQWFEPQAGISLVESLLAAIQNTPTAVTDRDDVIDDLQEYLAVLTNAKAINAKWHFALDM